MDIDKNKRFIRNFNALLKVCDGDRKKAREIQSILRKSHRNERELIYRESKRCSKLPAGLSTIRE